MKKKVYVLALSTLLSAMLIVGCGNKNDVEVNKESGDSIGVGSVLATEGTETAEATEENKTTETTEKTVAPTTTPQATAKPTAAPTEKPAATAAPKATAKPTEKPVATAKPTAAPTEKPAEQPQTPEEKPQATAKPTEKPVATAKPTAAPTEKPVPTPAPTEKPQPTPEPTPAPTEKPQEPCEHDFVMRWIYTPPTCTWQGEASWICTKCGYSKVSGCGYYEDHNYVCTHQAECGEFPSTWECSECHKWEDRYDGTCYTNDGDPYCDICQKKLY